MAIQHDPQPTLEHAFIRPGQVTPDRPAPDTCMECGDPLAVHALRAVLGALAIPHPATVGDGEVHDKILAERVMHTTVFLQSFLDGGASERGWHLDYFRQKVAEHPATGYRTWDEAVAEHRAGEQAEVAPADHAVPRCGFPASCGEFGHEHPHIDDVVSLPASGPVAGVDREAGQ
jgi:hypothetical protein